MHGEDIKSFSSNSEGHCSNISLRANNIIPSVDDNDKSIVENYVFEKIDFTLNFTTSDNSVSDTVRIITRPDEGSLFFNNIIISDILEFNISDITKLRYEPITPITISTQTITFQTSNSNLNRYFSNVATFTLNITT